MKVVIFRSVLESLCEGVSATRSVGPSVRRRVRNPFFRVSKMNVFLSENHRGSSTLTLLNVLGVLNVLNDNVLNMPMDASLALFLGG